MSVLATIKTKYILAGLASCLIIGIICLSAGLGIRSLSSKTIRSKSRALLRTQPFSLETSSTPVDFNTTTYNAGSNFSTFQSSKVMTTRRTTTLKITKSKIKKTKTKTTRGENLKYIFFNVISNFNNEDDN